MYDDIMVLLRPLLVDLASHANQLVDKIFFVTTMARPSVHPQFSIITLFEEAILDRLLASLADRILYGVHLEPERLHPDATSPYTQQPS